MADLRDTVARPAVPSGVTAFLGRRGFEVIGLVLIAGS